MSLLREIQADTIDTTVDISTVLRKCKILAARLGNNEFNSWVDSELNGYKSSEDLPEYRVLQVESHGSFTARTWEGSDIPIPPSVIPSKHRKYVKTSHFMDAISYYDNLLKTTGKSSSQSSIVSEPWPADLVNEVGSKIYKGANCINAWKVIPISYIAALIDTVRNRILNFVLEIESEAPDAGEAPVNSKPIPDGKVSQFFNTNIQGNVTNLATGSQNVVQANSISVSQNDLESLKTYFKDNGISDSDLNELDEAISEDGKIKSDFGNKVKEWIGKMIGKAGSTSWNIATSAATQILLKGLSIYYGLDN